MRGFRVYRELLQNRNLSRLMAGEFISNIGDWLYIVAIFVVIYEESGDPLLVGAFGAARFLPYVFLSIPAGMVADRFDRRMVLLVSDLFRGALMLGLAFLTSIDAPVVSIAAIAILAACGSTFFYPAMGAYLPALVKDERQLGPANSLFTNLGEVSYILGPALGGILLLFGSVSLAFLVNAATFVVIAAVLWTLPSSYARSDGAADAATAETVAAGAEGATDGTPEAPGRPRGLRELIDPRPLLGLLMIQFVTGFVFAIYQVVTVILAIEILKVGEEGNGFLNTAIGIGGIVGGLASGWLVLKRDSRLPVTFGVVLIGVGTIALGLTSSLPVALVAIGIAAAGGTLTDVLGTTVFQRLVPNEAMGRVTGIVTAAGTVTGVAGALIFPVALVGVGPFLSFVVLGVAATALMVLAVALIGPGLVREATPYESLVERIASLDLFTGVPKARLSAAMRRLSEREVVAGEEVVCQGDPADRFYIIATGSFAVTRVEAAGSEPVRLRTLGPEQVFGELGLLHGSPRTATVTAETDGILLVLEGKDFLELVGGGGPLEARLHSLYAGATPGGR